ncbi:MAG: 4-hydroxy-tetrahydrodipicolinate synthase [Planctomycetota bacterium]
MFDGVFTAIVTPFHQGEIDWEALERLIEFQIREGVHGLVPCGTTGESATLSAEEHDKVVRFTVDRAAGRVPVVAGTGSNSTTEAVERTRAARECGADAALVITPYYNKPTPKGMVRHFRAVAEAGLPVVAYNVPSRTAVSLDAATYRHLAEIPGVVACKEASGDFALAEAVLSEGKLQLLSGEDSLTFPLFCLGASGVVSVISNVMPRAMVDLFDYVQEGQLPAAREEHRRMLPVMRALFTETNPIPVKAALAEMGLMRDELRLPLVAAGDKTKTRLRKVLKEVALV